MPVKYIFVTGGVVSGLGKGIAAASIGLILKSAGLSVDVVKFDPYLNIDPGTMSPFEHGEVYVLDDGSETDLDLGHYERFLDVNLTKYSSVTAGKIYEHVLNEERLGAFLGKNVQVIPHLTNYIKYCFTRGAPDREELHVRLIEIGGSTGDLEGEVFLESFRQFRQQYKQDVLHFHLGYIPFLRCSGEYKTKPMQLSIRELLRNGLQPDLIGARYAPEPDLDLSTEVLDKLALFCNVPQNHVIKLPDVASIYAVPGNMLETNLKQVLESFLQTKLQPNLPGFYEQVLISNEHWPVIKIGIVAKYSRLSDAYLSILESLKIAGLALQLRVQSIFIDAEKLELQDPQEWSTLRSVAGVIVAGGFGKRGLEGKILAIQYVREQKVPFLGICLGLQMAVVEFARNVCGLPAVSSEMYDDPKEIPSTKEVVIDYMPGQVNIHKKGGTMRLGGYTCDLVPNTLCSKLFTQPSVRERHRHRLEVQQRYLEQYAHHGLVVSGKHYYTDNQGRSAFLVEMMELSQEVHPYFVGTQSHPEFLSRPGKPHPLFLGLLQAALQFYKDKV